MTILLSWLIGVIASREPPQTPGAAFSVFPRQQIAPGSNDTAQAGKIPAGVWRNNNVRVRPGAVEGKEISNAPVPVVVVLFDYTFAIHAEDSYIAIPQRVLIAKKPCFRPGSMAPCCRR